MKFPQEDKLRIMIVNLSMGSFPDQKTFKSIRGSFHSQQIIIDCFIKMAKFQYLHFAIHSNE